MANDGDRDRTPGSEDSRSEVDAETESGSSEHRRELALRRRRVQRKAARDGAAGPAVIPDGSGAPLGGDVRARMQPQLGADLSEVRVHTGGDSAEAAGQMGARAFTVGQDLHFARGEFNPGTREGDRLLAHELTHAVQGRRSGVQRKTESAAEEPHEGGALDADGEHHQVSDPADPAEQEADAVADDATEKLHGEPGGKSGGDKHDGEEKQDKATRKAPPIAAKLSDARVFRMLRAGGSKPAAQQQHSTEVEVEQSAIHADITDNGDPSKKILFRVDIQGAGSFHFGRAEYKLKDGVRQAELTVDNRIRGLNNQIIKFRIKGSPLTDYCAKLQNQIYEQQFRLPITQRRDQMDWFNLKYFQAAYARLARANGQLPPKQLALEAVKETPYHGFLGRALFQVKDVEIGTLAPNPELDDEQLRTISVPRDVHVCSEKR